ncbi:hypothetical protein HPP92_003268 [Vanilla planifolia]|uniref:Homeobox domain-containing protein n=1 Tax=Vanilla planifolia TaxID=51239 RepID=A0A835RV87_VANPL|nr:hypothetical protein HPP92_003627 [Vanilla planifolia]KAG0503196.1 hypothetical protein HPP92_003268 [Vanilla planifolia]
MGRLPHGGAPAFRFTQNEVMEMEACLQDVNKLSNSIPPRETICALADKFSASAERGGKSSVQPKQVLNWFQNRRYAQRTKVKEPAKPSVSPLLRDDAAQFRNVAPPIFIPQVKSAVNNPLEKVEVEFEAKSARDGAWYDVSTFLSYRMFESGDPEVRIRFSGFSVEEDEWVNVRKSVRQRSVPCEASECIAVLPGDLILCFQEGKEQALYFDAHVLDAQRRRHDVRGCRCRFLVRYDHDQSEEIVSLRKICRRPETSSRLQLLHSMTSGSADAQSTKDPNSMPQRTRRQRKLMDVNTDEVMTIALPAISQVNISAPIQAVHSAAAAAAEGPNAPKDATINDPVLLAVNTAAPQQTNTET